MESRTWGLFSLLLLLTCCTAAVLVVEDRKKDEASVCAESFQRLMGGLGFGSALDLSACVSDFDPRLDGSCSMDYGPIAGGACFRSRQGNSVLFYPPLKHGLPWPEK